MNHRYILCHYWIFIIFFGLLNKYMLSWCKELTLVGHTSLRQNYILRSWSDWTPWTVCSRTCGGGVRMKTRTCKIRIMRYTVSPNTCIGETVEYEICSRHNCSSDHEEFINYQCSQHNGQLIAGRKITEWIPHYNEKNPCELQCSSKDSSFVFSFGKVVDGTICPSVEPLESSLCINGRCMQVDCAGYVGRDNQRDMCGVCRGNNSTCIKYEHTFLRRARSKNIYNDIKDHLYDYNHITRIPAGARHIIVKEKSENNFLVLVDHEGNYHVNGNWKIQSPGRFPVHGSDFNYSRNWDGQEVISANGPIRFDVFIYVLGSGDIPTVHYEYWISTNNPLRNSLTEKKQSPSIQNEYVKTTEILNNLIESTHHSKPKTFPTRKFQGYKSYYHYNEILKSVPSWSIKRNLNYKQNFNKKLSSQYNSTLSSKNVDTKDVPTAIRFSTTEKPNARKNTVSKIFIKTPQSFELTVDQFGRPNGTLAQTRDIGSNHVYYTTKSRGKSVSVESRPIRKHRDEGRKNSPSIKGNCPPCTKTRHQTRNFCSSEFVLRVSVLRKEKEQQSLRYEVQVIQSYKNTIPISPREFLWTLDLCQCPKLRRGKEYILMGNALVTGSHRESRLTMHRHSFVRQYNQKRAMTLLRLARDRNSVCNKYRN
ncbi:ADAMTS-like protein 5 [Uloborus diversus]|uniref:ADAMTS-like protein 5 n=1 Tax=Uloborus diversus TaxID=327109 RepID=UPI00240A0D82|nr:ADAMTS-like protein 5 [Uloborus diversus]